MDHAASGQPMEGAFLGSLCLVSFVGLIFVQGN